MVKNAIAYIVVYFLIVNIIVVFDIERMSVKSFSHRKGRGNSARLQVFSRLFDRYMATGSRMCDRVGEV